MPANVLRVIVVLLLASLAAAVILVPLSAPGAAQRAFSDVVPNLPARSATAGNGSPPVAVAIVSSRPLGLAGIAERSATTPWPLGRWLTFARVPESSLASLAALPGVESLETMEPADREGESAPEQSLEPEPRAYGDAELAEGRSRLAELARADVPWSEAVRVDQTLWMRGLAKQGAPPGSHARTTSREHSHVDPQSRAGGRTTGWWDVGAGHNARGAWEQGWRGEGVTVALQDDSVDFVHPDLQGTWAVVNVPEQPDSAGGRPASAHNGWIQAFDPRSMVIYAREHALGYAGSESAGWLGLTRYISTTQVATLTRSWEEARATATPVTYGRACFTPLLVAPNAPAGIRPTGVTCDYKVPRTITVLRSGQPAAIGSTRSGLVRYGNHPDQWLGNLYGERVGVLLLDPNTSGVYDTVLVDLDNDHDFSDEKPASRDDPLVYRDMDGDGWPDISGGALHYIADGTTPLPGSYIFGDLAPPPPAWSAVMFTGAMERGDHGTMCASPIVGQGRLPFAADIEVRFGDMPGDGRLPFGPVQGMAPAARLVSVSNIYSEGLVYETAFQYMLRGHEPDRSEDDIQIASNSWSSDETHNEGWDERGRLLDRLVRTVNPTLSFVRAAGNRGPAHGAVAGPGSTASILVAAATEFGSTGYDSITRTSQIVFGDIISWSNKGPSAIGRPEVSVAANGSWSAAAHAVNYNFDLRRNIYNGGGTSHATPLTAGSLALVYQAFESRHGRWPTWEEARSLIMAGATHRGYDVLTQGAGMVDAGRSATIAGGKDGLWAKPERLVPGGYGGKRYGAFASLMYPGDSHTDQIRLHAQGSSTIAASVSAQRLRRVASLDMPFRSMTATLEAPSHTMVPDYLIPLDRSRVPQDAELMVIRASWPLAQFDLASTEAERYTADNTWSLMAYQHTDIDGDGRLWDDRDGDGIVDKTVHSGQASRNPAGTLPIDWAKGEIDRWEYARFGNDNVQSNMKQVFVHHPAQRWADGIYIGLQHVTRAAAMPRTDFRIRVDFYKYEAWPWVQVGSASTNVPAGAPADVGVTTRVPADAAPGSYDGAILVRYRGAIVGEQTLVVPVLVNVAARYDLRGSLSLAGQRAADPDALYDLGVVRGAFQWNGRRDSGDWRQFFVDVTGPAEPGTLLVTRTDWDDTAGESDLDVMLLGPKPDRYSDPAVGGADAEPERFGPYTLGTVGRSDYRFLGSGKWAFDTSTGGSREWVAGPVVRGLHEVLLHHNLASGTKLAVPFTTTVGTARVAPVSLAVGGKGCAPLVFRSSLDLPALSASGYGMGRPEVHRGVPIRQDDRATRSSASLRYPIQVTRAARLRIAVDGLPGSDIALVLLRDMNGDGVFTDPAEVVATGHGTTEDKAIEIVRPQDGDYSAWLWGYWVPRGKSQVDVTIDAPMGDGLTIAGAPTGPLPADTPVQLTVCYDLPADSPRDLRGEVHIGPDAGSPIAVIPVRLVEPVYLPATSR